MNIFIIHLSIYFSLICFLIGMFFSAIRLIYGPSAQDRILALDTLYINGMLAIMALGIQSNNLVYFDIALLISLFGFISSAAMSKFLLRGEVIES